MGDIGTTGILQLGESLLHHLISKGCIEYVSPDEEKWLTPTFSFVEAVTNPTKYTHLELTDVSFMGILGAMTPFCTQNQGARLTYWISMCKQAIWSHSNEYRGAVNVHNLWYGEAPLCPTKTSVLMGTHQNPVGTNIEMGIMTHPFNQEDGIVMSKQPLDQGVFTSTQTRTYSTSIKTTDQKSGELFHNPMLLPSVFGRKTGSYEHLQPNGLPKIGAKLNGGDVVIGKTIPHKKFSIQAQVIQSKRVKPADRKKARHDKSIQMKFDEKGTVTNTWLIYKPLKKLCIAKVQVATVRHAQVGDKITSTHSQKGVISYISPVEDMPFSCTTGRPLSLIMSPFGFPSRMTMGKLFELLLGKAVCLECDIQAGIDAQDFNQPKEELMEYYKGILRKHGYNPDCTERFIDGKTGEMIEAHITTGFVTYYKLNHQVVSKSHARSDTGPTNLATRQPIAGRSGGGGNRFGSMETNATISHGAAEIIKACTLTKSDGFDMYYCKKCGFPCQGNKTIGHYFCKVCQTSDHVGKVNLSFTSKYLTQNLEATGISVRLRI